MHELGLEEILSNIENEVTFSCYSKDKSFSIVIDEYSHFICSAIHNGGNLPCDIKDNMQTSKYSRWELESPHTGSFISSFPIRITVYDSLLSYDLSKDENSCILDNGLKGEIWKKNLSKLEQEKLINRHREFFLVLRKLVEKIEKSHSACLIYDIRSFEKYDLESNTFKIEINKSENVSNKFLPIYNSWENNLYDFKITGLKTEVISIKECNDYFSNFIEGNFDKSLVLVTKLEQVYCDSQTGDEFPERINEIKENLKNIIVQHAANFANVETKLNYKLSHEILSSEIESEVIKVDKSFYELLKNFELLDFVNPINLRSEKKKFLNSNYRKNPNFRYRPANIDSMELKNLLYQLPIQNIKDVDIQNLYKDSIEEYVSQIDMIESRGTERFLYSSLKYLGEPSDQDLSNAHYLLHCAETESMQKNTKSALETMEICKEMIQKFGFKGKVEISKSIAAKAMFLPIRKTLKIRSDATFSEKFAQSIGYHEIGGHMLTTFNALNGTLKILRLGFPLNTLSQEGIAILHEFLSNNLEIYRLKELAMRVIAVNHMVKVRNFKDTFLYLLEQYNLDSESAFHLCTRVYRGGGFTKDYLYLKGFTKIYKLYKKGVSLDNMYLGKTSHDYLPLLDELVAREILPSAKYKLNFDTNFKKQDKILSYVIDGLK